MTASSPRRRAPYAALMSSYFISMLGTSMSQLAIPWMVLTSTGSASKTGLVAFAEMAPYVMAQALAGPLVDRFGLRRSFVVGNILAGLATAAIPAFYAIDHLSFAVLIVLVAIIGLVRGAADCANSALLPATATIGQIPLERAAGLNTSANRTAILLGAPAAGLLVTLFGSPLVVLLDAVTFLIGAVLVAIYLHHVGEPAAAETGGIRGYGRGLAEGLRFVRGDRLILGVIIMVALMNLIDQGLSEVMLPVWVREELHSASALGLITGVFGLGSVIGNLIGAWLGPRLPRRAAYAVGSLFGGAPRFFILVLAGTLSPVLAVELSTAIIGGSINSVIGATFYERIPENLRARVLGVIRASAWVGIPFGALFAGAATEAFGVRAALIVSGVAYTLITLPPFIFPVWRQMRRPDPAQAAASVAEPTSAPTGAPIPAPPTASSELPRAVDPV
jgi:MFS family permease